MHVLAMNYNGQVAIHSRNGRVLKIKLTFPLLFPFFFFPKVIPLHKTIVAFEDGHTLQAGLGENRRLVTDEPVEFEK
jgi:hypothetical protein